MRRGHPQELARVFKRTVDVIIVDLVSYRRITISNRYSPDRFGTCFMPIRR